MKTIRRFTSVLVIVTMLLTAVVPVFAFSSNESRSAEAFFIDAGLLKGDGNGYGLDKTATRLEGIIILIRLVGKEGEAQNMNSLPCRFSDVPDWAKGYVNYADEENISKGVSANRFGVNEQMTADQYNTLLLRILGYDDNQGDFQWNAAVDKASELSILDKDMATAYQQKGAYTKADLMDTSFCYLEANYKDQNRTLLGMLTEDGVISSDLAAEYGLEIESWHSLTTALNSVESLTFKISGNQLNLTGTNTDPEKEYLIIHIDTAAGAKKADQSGKANSSGQYNLSLSLDSLRNGEYYVNVYGNDEKYGSYTSLVYSSVLLKKTDNDMFFEVSPVYGRNLRIYKGNQLTPSDYEMTASTKANTESVKTITSLEEEITAGMSNDYDKILAIHNWVADHIYYDNDYLNDKKTKTNIKSVAVLENRYGVCSGYANLTNDLLAAAGIPSRQVMGYLLGVTDSGRWDGVDFKKIDPNHVWNEAYVDGRWIIMDVTLDSSNRYEGGKFTEGEGSSQIYFDITVPFLSLMHETIIP